MLKYTCKINGVVLMSCNVLSKNKYAGDGLLTNTIHRESGYGFFKPRVSVVFKNKTN